MVVLGEAELCCKIKNEENNITFKVVEEKVTPILGLDTWEKLELIARVKTLKESECKDDIFEGLGCYKDYDIDLIENPKLESKPSRRIPHAIRDEVKQELDRMVKTDVIKPETEPTPAVSPMVIVRQKGEIRMCLDPSDVNKPITLSVDSSSKNLGAALLQEGQPIAYGPSLKRNCGVILTIKI